MKSEAQYRQIVATQLRKIGMYDERTEIANTLFGEYKGLRDLDTNQLIEMDRHIRTLSAPTHTIDNRKTMRNGVLHKLHLLGYITETEGKKDYTRANDFIQNIGANNPNKQSLYKLSHSELVKITTQVNEMYKKETYGNK